MNDGLLLFARYAFPPNRLGYCGTHDNQALLGYLTENRSDGGLREAAKTFEGAFPYLRLIAECNGLPDPLDRRVVEAYWVGNALLQRVGASPLYQSLRERFGPRMDARSFSWLTSSLTDGTVPHHNFHVFEIYRRAGLMRDDRAAIAIGRMDQCRISWGRVRMVEGAEAVVERSALQMRDGKLELGKPAPVRVSCPVGYGVGELLPGVTVSIHWSWVCERLNPARLGQLRAQTLRAVAHTNRTL